MKKIFNMNCTSVYAVLVINPTLEIFVLENLHLKWWVISLVLLSTIWTFNIILIYNKIEPINYFMIMNIL